ncbi:hypothetical protein, partial [Tannerella forsythia]|uniref:hypothetical protein n=1 Tax=Tannerella forsythia TaxID=28112 RepID=UPI002431E57A
VLYQLSYFRVIFFAFAVCSVLHSSCQGCNHLSFLGKVVLYQLSYFRVIFFAFAVCPVLHSSCQGCNHLSFWGKVVLYQLSYFRVVATSAKYGCKDR